MRTISRTTASIAISALILGLGSVTTASEETAPDPRVGEAKGLVKEFATTLKGELQAGMQAGGPTAAIKVCQERAPAIAQEISERSGWTVKRPSLKTRNAALNTPDDWERAVLVEFDERKAAGESPEKMAFFEETEDVDGNKRFRFMKAIPTGQVCLACHGAAITPDVAAALDAAYPDDQARGYAVGDVRGAFSVSKPVD